MPGVGSGLSGTLLSPDSGHRKPSSLQALSGQEHSCASLTDRKGGGGARMGGEEPLRDYSWSGSKTEAVGAGPGKQEEMVLMGKREGRVCSRASRAGAFHPPLHLILRAP